jgi:predicted HicB family RNase H-like nuclease
MMQYKGYTGTIEIDEEEGTLHSRVQGIRDVVNYQGQMIDEIR